MSEVRDEILKRFQVRQTVRCLEPGGDTSGNRIWNTSIGEVYSACIICGRGDFEMGRLMRCIVNLLFERLICN